MVAPSTFFGVRLAVSGETVVAGAPFEDGGGLANAGVAYALDLGSNIFADGFESGDLAAWSSSVP